MRPGTEVALIESPPPRSIPTDTGVWFVTGVTEKGSADEAVAITSLGQFEDRFGSRLANSVLYDSLELYFAEGGSLAYIGRLVGDTPVKASANLSDGTGTTLTIQAADYGSYGNDLNIEVVAGGAPGTFVLVVSSDADGELERSPDLADKQAAIEWASASDDIRAVAGAGTGDPVVAAPASLTGGTDDSGTIDDTNRATALGLFTRGLGPGQVSHPGVSTLTAHSQLLAHAQQNNRVAILDGPDSSSVSAVRAAATDLAEDENARYGGLWGNWLVIRGLVPHTTRTVPPSPEVAALMARSDRASSPNVPAAGANGQAATVIDLSVSFSDDDYESLSGDAVNLFRQVYGVFENRGYRTLAPKDTNPNWWQLSHVRLYMAVVAQGQAVAERYVFAEIDGQRRKLSQFEGDLVGVVTPYYIAGSLYGETPGDAFRVDATSPSINPDDQLQDGVVRGVIYLRMSPFAELVRLEIVKLPITQPLPA
jgi:hypothetical protein